MTKDNVKNLIRLYGFDDEIILTTKIAESASGEVGHHIMWRGLIICCSFCFKHKSCLREEYQDKMRCILNDIRIALK